MNNSNSTNQLDIIYKSVFRDSTKEPGFYYQDFGTEIDSKTFRKIMVELKEALSEKCNILKQKQLCYQTIGRFDQQNSSRFHRDSAKENTFLMLGYEPTKVQSKVFIADYMKYIENHDISLTSFFGKHKDVNTIEDDDILKLYSTELTPFPKNHYRLLLLNNSKSFNENAFGVFHRGEIYEKIKNENRVLNYIMLNLCDKNVKELHDKQSIIDFVNTHEINK